MTQPSDARAPSPDERRPAHAWHLVLGLTLWLVWFGVTYGGVAVACAVAPPEAGRGVLNWVNASVLGLAAVTMAAFAAGAWVNWRKALRMAAGGACERPRFVARVSVALYVIAAVSTAAVALPALMVPPCV